MAPARSECDHGSTAPTTTPNGVPRPPVVRVHAVHGDDLAGPHSQIAGPSPSASWWFTTRLAHPSVTVRGSARGSRLPDRCPRWPAPRRPAVIGQSLRQVEHVVRAVQQRFGIVGQRLVQGHGRCRPHTRHRASSRYRGQDPEATHLHNEAAGKRPSTGDAELSRTSANGRVSVLPRRDTLGIPCGRPWNVRHRAEELATRDAESSAHSTVWRLPWGRPPPGRHAAVVLRRAVSRLRGYRQLCGIVPSAEGREAAVQACANLPRMSTRYQSERASRHRRRCADVGTCGRVQPPPRTKWHCADH